MPTTPRTLYCTILAANYLPKALTLADSLARHQPGSELVVLLIDSLDDESLPDVPVRANTRLVSTAFLDLGDREVLRLATIYNLVEFATSVKPPLLRKLLDEADQVAYLDPDTYVTSPMSELPVDLAASPGGILLTPHFLDPIVGSDSHFSEGHLLNVGVFNLGFCAVDRRARPFVDWWWGHLQEECRWEPLSGLFVDQKWVDIGATLFDATAWRHRGYNVGVANLHERLVVMDAEGYMIADHNDRLRLFHFHAFDPRTPHELTTRVSMSTAHLRADGSAVDRLCTDYADELLRNEKAAPAAPAYPYDHDTTGRPVSRHLRRAYRLATSAGEQPPSPFRAGEAHEWARWRRRALAPAARELLGDAGRSFMVLLPDEYARAKKRFPRLMGVGRRKLVRGSAGIWRG